MRGKSGRAVWIVGWVLGIMGGNSTAFAGESASIKGQHFFMESREGGRLISKQECWVVGEQFRMVFHQGYPRRCYIIFNGLNVLNWYEGESEARKLSPKLAAQWRWWLSRYQSEHGELKKEGSEVVEGVSCERQSFLSLPDVNGPSVVIREWIDPKTTLVLKREVGEDSGLATFLLTRIDSGVAIDPVMFRLPEGVKEPLPPPQTGQRAPDFALKRYDTGEVVKLSQFNGRVVLLNFFATWCGPCVKEIPGFVKVYQAYRDRGVEFLSVDVGERGEDPKGEIAAFVKKEGVTWSILVDDASQVSHRLYAAKAIPLNVLIDRQGVIQMYQKGRLPEENLTPHLDRVLGAR